MTSLQTLRISIEKRSLSLLQFSVAILFIWFGSLKLFHGSAAENLAGNTIVWLTGGLIPFFTGVKLLGVFECLLGIGLVFKKLHTVVIPLLYLQMLGTAIPLFIFPDHTWSATFIPTLEGQYIIKNVVLIAAIIVLGAKARGSKLIVDRGVAAKAEKKQDEKLSR